jgi:hypothetical protein
MKLVLFDDRRNVLDQWLRDAFDGSWTDGEGQPRMKDAGWPQDVQAAVAGNDPTPPGEVP